jgi:allophanate hydrolase
MTAVERVLAAYRSIAEADRPEVWISLRPEAEALADAEGIDARIAGGEELPLAGATLAVKDNIDVAGIPTTAGCPAFAYTPERSAPAVQRLRDAGAVVLGKTNLDQFATGLVGTRSPYGAVRDARRPEYVSGGSSSGSAVAVARGQVELALGTDTAGSGRVPAAFQGIVGVKPTRGLVPVLGVVPDCRTLQCVSVFARDLMAAEQGAALMAGFEPDDALSRARPVDAPLTAPPRARVAVPAPEALPGLSPATREAFAATAARLERAGAELVSLDPAPFLEAGELLYGGAFVAERYAAVGAFIEAYPSEVDPTVAAIVAAASSIPAWQLVADGERRDRCALAARRVFAAADALLLPTVSHQPTIAEVLADPIGENGRLGVYTSCANLLDLCGVAVPAGEADGGCFGVTVMAPAFHDAVAADVARLLTREGQG